MEDGIFKINLSENHLKAGDDFTNGICTYKVLETPKRKWYKVLIQWLTLGIIKAPYEYGVELIKFYDISIINYKLKSCVNTDLYVCGIDEYDKTPKNSGDENKGN